MRLHPFALSATRQSIIPTSLSTRQHQNPFPPSAKRFPLLEAAHRHPDLHRSGLCGRVLWDLESLSQNPAHLVPLCDRCCDHAVDLDRAPLLHHKKDTFRLQLLADVLAIAVYVSLIAVDLDGWGWYLHLALPIILLLGALFLFWGLTMGQRKRSTLSSIALVIGSSGVFTLGVEGLIDGYLHGSWSPSWSLIVLAICVILLIPLIVIRRVPSLREEVRRRFHM